MRSARLTTIAFVLLGVASCAGHAPAGSNPTGTGGGPGSLTAGNGAGANAASAGMIATSAGGRNTAGASAGTGGAGHMAAGGAAGSAGTSDAGRAGGTSGINGSSGASGSPGSSIDCDPRKVLCKRVAPQCPEGQVPSVSGSCYGDCVPAESCPCTEPAACPDPNHFTCHMSQAHCGPFV